MKKLLTYEKYLQLNPNSENKLHDILIKCSMHRPIDPNSFIIENKSTILIFQPFFDRKDTYAVSAIYTKQEDRNKGSAKKLLTNLNFSASLYFDTYNLQLINILKSLGAYEETIFKNKDSTQLILEIKTSS